MANLKRGNPKFLGNQRPRKYFNQHVEIIQPKLQCPPEERTILLGAISREEAVRIQREFMRVLVEISQGDFLDGNLFGGVLSSVKAPAGWAFRKFPGDSIELAPEKPKGYYEESIPVVRFCFENKLAMNYVYDPNPTGTLLDTGGNRVRRTGEVIKVAPWGFRVKHSRGVRNYSWNLLKEATPLRGKYTTIPRDLVLLCEKNERGIVTTKLMELADDRSPRELPVDYSSFGETEYA